MNKNSTSYPEILYDELKKLNANTEDPIKSNLFNYQQYVYDYMTKMDTRGILLYHSVGSGKCMKIDTPILMYDGTIKKIQDIQVGEFIMGDDSTPRRILSLARGVDKMYDIISNKRSKYTVNQSHILCLKIPSYPSIKPTNEGYIVNWTENNEFKVKKFVFSKDDNNENTNLNLLKNILKFEAERFLTTIKNSQIIEISVLDYLKLSNRKKKLLKGYKTIIEFNEIKTKLDPYALGIWLGDMNTNDFVMVNTNNIIAEISNLEIMNDKKIPHEYKCNSTVNRLKLLAGLIDITGTYNDQDGYVIKINNELKTLINDIVFVCKSLGFLCYKKKENDKMNIYINGSNISDIPSQEYENINIKNLRINTTSGSKIKVVYNNIDNYFGFTIDKNQRYVLGNFTVTHNTITSISIAEYFRKLNKDIIIISSKSLQNNYKKEIESFSKTLNPDITENEVESIISKYKFVTSNAKNMIKSLESKGSREQEDKLKTKKTNSMSIDNILEDINTQNLEDKIIIIDEAHNLFNSISNGSKIANEFYEIVMNTKKIKLIFLTGTPIVNTAFEASICFNMLYGPIYSDTRSKRNKKEYSTILPEYYTDFVKYFVDESTSSIKNENKFMNRIFGLVSYYGDFYTEMQSNVADELKKTLKKENYPDRLPIKFEIIPMSKYQNSEYAKARNIEKKENSSAFNGKGEFITGGAIVKEKNSASTSYRIKSRQLSNIYINDETELTLDNLNEYSPKLERLYSIIDKEYKNSISLVYSNFLKYGILAFSKVLELNGYKLYNPNDLYNKEYKYYSIFSGDQTLEEKRDIVTRINTEENKNGDLISIILISKSGTEGLDLKRIRSVHILEPFFNFSVIQQVIARGVRYKSHIDMDESEKTVQPYIYLSDYNKEILESEKTKLKESKKKKKEKIELTTDINLFKNSLSRQEIIYKFLKVIASTSIECPFFNKNNINYNCFKCISDNKDLFHTDIHTDIELSNNCKRTSTISATEIIINSETYYYTLKNKDDKNIENIDVYKFNESLNGYNKINSEDIKNKILKTL